MPLVSFSKIGKQVEAISVAADELLDALEWLYWHDALEMCRREDLAAKYQEPQMRHVARLLRRNGRRIRRPKPGEEPWKK